VAWQQTRTELAGIKQRLPELREQQRQIEDELLQHAGPEALRRAIEQQLERTKRHERHMEQASQIEHQEQREALAERTRSDDPRELVKVYRDAEKLTREAERQAAAAAQVRSLEALKQTREAMAEARQVIEQSRKRHKDNPELAELDEAIRAKDAQAKTWQLDPSKRPGLDEVEGFKGEADELRERVQGKAQELNDKAKQALDQQIDERLRGRPAPGEDGPRRSGPRFSGPR